ncbi:hypothetical protein GUJ93_ZPchr0002g23143 [Zizania palustris]|uniref:Uncharacterized protein n=1 Tax=Zizania palustris TaxID=103762 RepID=A0A8J5VBP7_ZIZPA|nr:hypothetical protein GUJ93_ZPchr0002g23143 [Zizania palustris]
MVTTPPSYSDPSPPPTMDNIQHQRPTTAPSPPSHGVQHRPSHSGALRTVPAPPACSSPLPSFIVANIQCRRPAMAPPLPPTVASVVPPQWCLEGSPCAIGLQRLPPLPLMAANGQL